MAKRGPAPTPKSILEQRGSRRADTNPDQMVAPREKPNAPKWLSKDARTIWQYITAELYEIGVLAKLDRTALARYCDYCAQWIEAKQHVEDDGPTSSYTDTKDVRRTRPSAHFRVMIELGRELARLEQQFGLTPSARTRVDVPEGNKKHAQLALSLRPARS